MSNKKTMRKMRKIRTMRRMRKTKMINKNHKYTQYKNRLIGGNSLSNDNNASQIMNEVKKERKFNIASLGNIPMFKKSSELAEGLTIKGIEHLGILLGVDLSNTQSINEKLTQIKIALADPKNKEKVKEIVSEAAKVGAVAIEAASPFIKPLLDKSVELGSDALTKMSEAAVKIGLNTAEEIPGVGVVIGTVRSLSNAGEAFAAATNAASEVVTTTSDSINAATKNFERLMKEKMNSVNRINESLNKFQQPFNGQKIMQLPSSPQMPMQKITGGVKNYTRKLHK
jgi:hypothetical protein